MASCPDRLLPVLSGGNRPFVHQIAQWQLSGRCGDQRYGRKVVGSGLFTGTMVRGRMILPEKPFTAAPVIVVMLVFQIVMLGVSFGSHPEISILCTGPAPGSVQWPFALLHISFLGLFALGVISLKYHRLRPFYLIVLLVSLAALPVQAKLVHSDKLQCDTP